MTNTLNRIRAFMGRYIDYRAAVWGALVMACIVFGVNYFKTWNLPGSLTASLKQGAYTFLFGGAIMKLCEYISMAFRRRFLSLALAVLIPSCIAIGLTFTLHNMKGTPRPVASTIPTAILIVPITAIWGYRKRSQVKHDTPGPVQEEGKDL
jgi:hypothetical protein